MHRSGDLARLLGLDRVRAGAAVEADQQELRQVAAAVRVVGEGPMETNAGRAGVGQEEGLELRRAGAPEQLAGPAPLRLHVLLEELADVGRLERRGKT